MHLPYSGDASSLPIAMDVNDVSYIFPLSQDEVPHPNLKLIDFLSQEKFYQVLDGGENNSGVLSGDKSALRNKFRHKGRTLSRAKNWHLVSFRYINCEPPFEIVNETVSLVGGDCRSKLNLVFQPFKPGEGALGSALHLIYDIGLSPKSSLNPILADLLGLTTQIRKLGLNTAQIELRPHPGLTADLKNNWGFGKSVTGFLEKHLKNNGIQLKVISAILETKIQNWIFFTGSVEEKSWIPFKVPLAKLANVQGSFRFKCGASSLCEASPQIDPNFHAEKFPRFLSLFDPNSGLDQRDPTESILKTAEIIDSPLAVNTFQTSCVSCHQSANIRSQKTLYFTSQTPLGVTPFVAKENRLPDTTALLNFAYNGTHPRISIRTAEESALVVDSVNQLLGLPNPGLRCRESEREKLWACLNEEKTSTESCYSQFCSH